MRSTRMAGTGTARARRPRAGVRAAGVTALALLGVAATACDDGEPSPPPRTPATGRTATEPGLTDAVDLGPVRFRVGLPAGATFARSTAAPVPGRDSCPGPTAALTLRGGARLSFESWDADCPAASGAPGNGRHGVYRTVADVPADARGRETVPTALGDAVVFDQEYYECTNRCDRWTETVAVITLAAPAAADHPALVVRADKGAVGHQDLVAFLRSGLLPPDPAPGSTGPAGTGTAPGGAPALP